MVVLELEINKYVMRIQEHVLVMRLTMEWIVQQNVQPIVSISNVDKMIKNVQQDV